MEQLLKIGDNENVGGEVELSEFEKKLEFARPEQIEFEEVTPNPYFCVKTKHLRPDGGKVFLNVCGSHAVPCPPKVTDRELQERVESAEEENLTVAYRVPISLGAPRVEKDNKKLDCDVFDIVVNEAYLKSIEENQQKYQIGFMVSVGLQGLEEKYQLDLDRNWIMLKNRKCMGKPLVQRIRKKSTNPKLEEFADGEIGGEKPEIDIVRSGTDIIANVALPKVEHQKQIKLEVNQDSLKLIVSPNLYKIRCWLTELQLDSDRTQATFDYATKTLRITSPIF